METYTKDSTERRLLKLDFHKQEEWERYEWKCIGCKQSLTHLHFDNNALMPYLENHFSDQPSIPSIPSIPSHALLSEGDSPPAAQGLQDAECHQLLCNDCRYDIDEDPTKSHQPQSPIRSSRYIKYDSFLYRYFPGMAGMWGTEEFTDLDPPRYWPTYMVRCTECKTWKEIRHYLNEEDPNEVLKDFLDVGCINLTNNPFLDRLTTCDQCIGVHETYLSVRLALLPIWKRINRLESWDFCEWPGIFGKRKPIDTERSCIYVQSVRGEFAAERDGKRGLNRERFRSEGLANFRFKLPNGEDKSLAELDEEDMVQKVETCLDYYIWLWRIMWYMLGE